MKTFTARISRSLVTVLALTFIQVIAGPILAPTQTSPSAEASTFDSTGLILNWDMENLATYSGSGTTLGDSSFNSSTGTMMAGGSAGYPSWTSSAPKYLTFSGNSTNFNYVKSVDLKPKLDGYATSAPSMQNISVFTWVYPTANGIIIDEVNADNGWQDSWIEMADGKFSFRIWSTAELISDTATPLNYWYYVGLTYDYQTQALKAYVNGKKVGELTGIDRSAPWESISGYTSQFAVGRYDPTHLGSASGGNFRFGALHIFNKALSQSVITSNYESSLYRFGPTVGNPSNISQLVNRSDTFSATACTGIKSATTCNYRWESSSDNGVTWATVGTSSTSYVLPNLVASDSGKQFRLMAIDPGSAGDVPEGIRNFGTSAVASLSVTVPPGAETDTALSLSGTGQYAEVADGAGSPFDVTGTFTLEAWVKPSNACPSSGAVISKLSYMVYCQSGKWFIMALSNGSSGSGVTTEISVEEGEWHHLAFTKTATSGDVLFYYDGIYVKTVATGATTMSPNDHAFQIGRYDSNAAYWFQGQIDEVRVYNSQRSQAQILADMKSYGSISDSNLMAYYDFNEGTGNGTTIYNRKLGATSATDLIISGSPLWRDVKSVETSTLVNYTIVKFPRSYINNVGGWKVPTGATKVSALVVAGGGGGGARAAGGGGAGGLVYRPILNLTVGSIETVTVGQGGAGGFSVPAFTNRQGINGQNSALGAANLAIGGGGGGGAGDTGNTYRVGLDGGSGGGASGDAAGNNSSAAYGVPTQITTTGYGLGNRGGSGVGGTYWNGGGGGGSGGVGAHSSTSSWVAGNGGAGTLDPVGGSNLCLAAGGGGGTINGGTKAGDGGICSSGTVTAGAGTIGATVAGSATANSGSGGGGSGYNSGDVGGGHGGSGVVIVRWITASKPTFTPPKIAYLNAGMTETFTTNVATDSATVNLIRTFRWESSTSGVNGTYSVIKQGTGANNAFFSWVPTDTSTSGSTFAYRVVVTDSDTAGLFIVETSTPVWAVINGTLNVSGSTSIGKAINLAKSETYTITLGTSTYRPTLSPVIPGITLDTSTAGLAVIKIADTMTVGTYYETLTVIDSVSATIVTPLTIVVAPPPSLTSSSEQVDSSTVLYLDAGNSASLNPGTTSTWKDLSGRGLQANFPPSSYPVGTTSCTEPTYSSDYMGILNFSTDDCGYVPNVGASNLTNNYTYQTWVKRNGAMQVGSTDADYTSIFATPWTGGRQVGLTLHWRHVLNSADYYLEAAVWGNPTWYAAQWPTAVPVNTWVFVTVTFNGSAITISLDNQNPISAPVSSAIDKASIDSGLIIGKRFDSGAGYFFNGSIASLRLYNRILSGAEITQNYNATKERFLSTNNTILRPTQKYGQSQQETFTVTSGYGNKSTVFANGNRTGIKWDTATANTVKLAIQESLTVGTYNDTVTVTDSLGQSSYLPITMTISKADTITVTLRNPKTVVYTGLPAALLPDINITGLVGSDTGTATRLYSAPVSLPGATDTYTAIVRSSTVPTQVETYTVSVETLTSLSVGSLSNYQGVIYETSTLTITQANQPALMVNYFGAVAGSTFTLKSYGGAGTGAYTETTTSGSSALNCSISGHVLSNASPSNETKTCAIIVTRAASRNYKAESMTATIYFFAFTFNAEPKAGSGPGIGLSGINTVTLDSGTAPTISALSTNSLSLSSGGNFTITGGGFGTSQITVKFWRNKIIYATSTDGTTLVIPVSSISAVSPTTGKVMVITANGIAVSTNNLTITP